VQVVRSISQAGPLRGRVVTIGNFDGVHRGHQHLLAAAGGAAATLGVGCTVLTFDPAPRDVLRPGNGIPRIQTLGRKLVHLERAGVDAVLVLPFDHATAAVEPDVFAQEVLGDALDARALVVGHDFRFGRQRRGDAALLREVLQIPVTSVDALSDDEGPVSSSRVRAHLSGGDVERAAALLGRPHEVCGVVVQGDRRGRTIGFPTANVVPDGGMLPPDGVYAAQVHLGDQRVGGVANLGLRPTFGGTERRLEVHLFDWSGDLYGQALAVELRSHLREERKFAGLEALVAQIHVDAAEARARLGR